MANSKKQGFAEGSRKVKKAFANGLNIEVENIDDEDPLNIVSKVKELITVAPNVKDIENKLFEANNKIEELNKIIPIYIFVIIKLEGNQSFCFFRKIIDTNYSWYSYNC